MRSLCFLLILSSSLYLSAEECIYPAASINWIMRYCAFEAETDDEIVIQESACFKSAAQDLSSKDECKIKEKYKSKICEKINKIQKKHKSVAECLKDKKVGPFFAGD